MLIALKYNENTGQIEHPTNGTMIGNWTGLADCESKATNLMSVDDLISLKKADYTVDEITEMRRKGLL